MLDRRALFAAATSASLAAPIVAHARQRPSRAGWTPDAETLEALPGWMRLARVPGVSIAALNRGALAWSRTFGIADAATGAPLNEDTLFEAASTSKPVFAYAVLQWAEQGKIDLDRPLALTLRPPYLPADARIDQITARHVLTHTSGLRNWGEEGDAESFRPLFTPGERCVYSGEGFFWLQLVIEHVSGVGLDAFMRAQLFEPAGMTRSMFALGQADLANAAFGHQGGRRAPGQGLRDVIPLIEPLAAAWNKPVRAWSHQDWLRSAALLDPARPTARVRFQNAASSLYTTAKDYARFLTLLMDGAPRASWRISERMRREMISPIVPISVGAPLWRGLGWSVERCGEALRFGHEGNNDDRCTAYVGAEAERGRGLVIFANAGAGFGLYQRIVRAVTDCDQLSFIADLGPAA